MHLEYKIQHPALWAYKSAGSNIHNQNYKLDSEIDDALNFVAFLQFEFLFRQENARTGAFLGVRQHIFQNNDRPMLEPKGEFLKNILGYDVTQHLFIQSINQCVKLCISRHTYRRSVNISLLLLYFNGNILHSYWLIKS